MLQLIADVVLTDDESIHNLRSNSTLAFGMFIAALIFGVGWLLSRRSKTRNAERIEHVEQGTVNRATLRRLNA